MRRSFYFSVCFLAFGLATLSACEHTALDKAKYWQRIDVTEARYLSGASAQKRLNRDIAVCVRDLKYAIRTNELRAAIPPSIDPTSALPLNEDQIALNGWDTPEYDGALRTEHIPYQTFEDCMRHNGWRRTEFVPDDVIIRAKQSYYDNLEENAPITDHRTYNTTQTNKSSDDNYNE